MLISMLFPPSISMVICLIIIFSKESDTVGAKGAQTLDCQVGTASSIQAGDVFIKHCR